MIAGPPQTLLLAHPMLMPAVDAGWGALTASPPWLCLTRQSTAVLPAEMG